MSHTHGHTFQGERVCRLWGYPSYRGAGFGLRSVIPTHWVGGLSRVDPLQRSGASGPRNVRIFQGTTHQSERRIRTWRAHSSGKTRTCVDSYTVDSKRSL